MKKVARIAVWTLGGLFAIGIFATIVFEVFLTGEQNVTSIVIVFATIATPVFAVFFTIHIRAIEDINAQREKNNCCEHFTPLELMEPFDWLHRNTSIIRANQKFDFTLKPCKFNNNPAIRLEGIHTYTIKNPSDTEPMHHKFAMITELGWQTIGDTGGFTLVKLIPVNCDAVELTKEIEVFKGKTLNAKMKHANTKQTQTCAIFEHDNCVIPAGGSLNVEFHAFGIYRHRDRFIWWTQQFSSKGTAITIKKDKLNGEFWYQPYHHKQANIKRGEETDEPDKIVFDIMFPYEGLAIYWNMDEEVKD
jgi:hypothetical protein